MRVVRSRRSSARRALAAVAVLASFGLVAACGDSDSGSSSASASAGGSSLVPAADRGSLKSEVPKAFAKGITVASQADIAPLTYVDDSGKTVGFDQDMLNAVSDVLGVKFTIKPVTFENLILGLESGKYNFVADPTITKERMKKYDMVSYFTSSNSVVTAKDSADIAGEVTAVCGMKIGVVTGEVISAYITSTIDPACTAAGKKKVDTTEYKDFANAVLALKGENVKGIFVDTMTFSQLQSTGSGGDLRFNGPSRVLQGDSSYSFLKGSDNTALEPVVQKAINKLIDNGVYAKILAKYNLQKSGLTGQSKINPPSNL